MNKFQHPALPFGAHIDDDGTWCQVLNRAGNRQPRPTLFLDRDGVVVEEVHYLSRPEDVQLTAGAARVIAAANAKHIPVILVTNQAGIGYGKFDWQDFIDVQERIVADLDAENAFVNAVYACPFHAKGRPPYQHPDHPCRKPNPGMLEKAARHFAIDKQSSWIIGDRANDLEAGKRFQLAGGLHVATGHGASADERQAAAALTSELFQVVTAPDIGMATDLLDLFDASE
ncbi:MAG: HAD-IIIA family hydrolase [Rhodospirillales bacterium]|nr:HAD-IIIA family hydrolase [Rhodospirillales bacterium]